MREIGEHEFEGAGDRLVTLRWRPSAPVSGEEYALQVTFSNVYFHVGMAYAILRKSGVDVGKLDFLGEIYRHEA
jgi:hypothetical protein